MTTIDISIMNQPVVNEVFDPDNGLWLATLVDQNCMGINPASGNFLLYWICLYYLQSNTTLIY